MKLLLVIVLLYILCTTYGDEGVFNGLLDCKKFHKEGFDPSSCLACVDLGEDWGFFKSSTCNFIPKSGKCIYTGEAEKKKIASTRECKGFSIEKDKQTLCQTITKSRFTLLPSMFATMTYGNKIAPFTLATSQFCQDDHCPRAGSIPPIKSKGYEWSDAFITKHGIKQKCNLLHSIITHLTYFADDEMVYMLDGFRDKTPPTGARPNKDQIERKYRSSLRHSRQHIKGHLRPCNRIMSAPKEILNSQTSVGKETPLILAIKVRAFETAKILFMQGADITIKDALGMTAIDWAYCLKNKRAPGRIGNGEGWNDEIIEMLEKWDPVSYSVEKCGRDSNRVYRKALHSGVGGSGGNMADLLKLAMHIGIDKGMFDKFHTNYRKNMLTGRKVNQKLVDKLCPRDGADTGWNPAPEQKLADKMLKSAASTPQVSVSSSAQLSSRSAASLKSALKKSGSTAKRVRFQLNPPKL